MINEVIKLIRTELEPEEVKLIHASGLSGFQMHASSLKDTPGISGCNLFPYGKRIVIYTRITTQPKDAVEKIATHINKYINNINTSRVSEGSPVGLISVPAGGAYLRKEKK